MWPSIVLSRSPSSQSYILILQPEATDENIEWEATQLNLGVIPKKIEEKIQGAKQWGLDCVWREIWVSQYPTQIAVPRFGILDPLFMVVY